MAVKKENQVSPVDMSAMYRSRIVKNLEKLMTATKTSQNALAQQLSDSGLRINQGTISKYLKGELDIQLSVIIKICEIFKIPIEELVSDSYLYKEREIIIDQEQVTAVRQEKTGLFIPELGNKFITDPDDLDFNGYLQTYHVYFFPTLSSEERILTGTLTLAKDGNVCAASLLLNTNRKNRDGAIYKTYSGCALISTSVHAMYIILSSPEEGELCLINLRHFFIRHQKLNCRMAEVITNAAGETHAPTVHRMLLSREEIREADIESIKSQLHLNSNDILISEAELGAFAERSQDHADLVEHLTKVVRPVSLYSFKEDFVRSNAMQFLTKEAVLQTLSEIRNHSYKMRYNKVSSRVDETVHNMLRYLGYYQDQEAYE